MKYSHFSVTYCVCFYVQLSVDHVTNNEDELARLANLGLDIPQILRNRRIGNQENTRSIGDYGVKGGYKDFDILRCVSFVLFANPLT